MNQNAISRLESPDYGKPTLTTLKRIASALDVALVVRFVPFSEFIDWISGTPHTVAGLSTTEALAVPTFEMEEDDGVLQPALAAMSASATPIQDSEEIAQIKVQRGMSAANSQTLMFGQEFSAEPVRRPQIPKSLLLGTPEKAQGVSPWR